MSTPFTSLPPYETVACVFTSGAMATGKVVLACSAFRSSIVTCGRFLYFHQALPLTPHFPLCTQRIFGPRQLNRRRDLDDLPHCSSNMRNIVMHPLAIPQQVGHVR